MSANRDKGTRAETACVRAALAAGIPADRRPPRGSADDGDVWLHGGKAVVEVKAGRQCDRPSPRQLAAWWAEAEAEAMRVLACDLAVLVVKRPGSGRATDWTAYVRLDELAHVLGGQVAAQEVAALQFGVLLDMLTAAGWAEGTP